MPNGHYSDDDIREEERKKFKPLLDAIDGIMGLLTADLNALEPWEDEIDILLEAYEKVKVLRDV